MAELSRFFDSTPEDERYYSADEFAEYFRRVLTNGIFNGGTNLKVDCDGSNIQTYVQEGFAWLEGYMYKVQDEPFYLTHDLPDIQHDRIDRIVLRLDRSLEVRSINAKILKGEPSATPVVPSLTRNDNIYDIALAQVKIEAGKSYIQAYQITDERLNTDVCGLVNSLIQADTTQIFNQFQDWYNVKTAEYANDWEVWTGQKTTEYNNWVTAKQSDYDDWVAAKQSEYNTSVTGFENQWQAMLSGYEQQWNDWFTTNTTAYDNSWNTWFGNVKTAWDTWFAQTKNEWITWFTNQQESDGYLTQSDLGVNVAKQQDFSTHLEEAMPHMFVDGTTTYRYGWKVESGVLKFVYEEVV
jgi:hypothetical protein